MALQTIHENILSLYNQVDKITKENHLASIIYSVALKALSAIFCTYSTLLGVTIFFLSSMFDISLISHSKEIYSKIEKTFKEVVKSSEPPKVYVRPSQYSTHHYYYQKCNSVEDFLDDAFVAIEDFFNSIFPY